MNIEEAKRAIRELDASAQEPAMALWGWTEIKK
ncbi:Uncharacterised protein [Streptococcus pyogenes]|nr:Uncharacterised protein [Streptococcus pyogenes]VGS90545.1 Uncharacterised protein [Streptococcus pyogenes]